MRCGILNPGCPPTYNLTVWQCQIWVATRERPHHNPAERPASFNFYPQPLWRFWKWGKEIMKLFNIHSFCAVQLHVKSAEQLRQSNIDFRVRKASQSARTPQWRPENLLNSNAGSRTASKWLEVFLKPLSLSWLKPALGDETSRGREDRFIIMDHLLCHTD